VGADELLAAEGTVVTRVDHVGSGHAAYLVESSITIFGVVD
jgi:hypothetical protein